MLAATLLLAGAGRSTGPERPGDDRSLTAAEVTRSFEPYAAAVRTCYLDHGRSKTADGTLRIELLIHPGGKVFRFGFVARGVTNPWLQRLDGCLRPLSMTWAFPVRRGFTTAVMPFLFQRTRAPGAGPIESCWDPRGCPTHVEGSPR